MVSQHARKNAARARAAEHGERHTTATVAVQHPRSANGSVVMSDWVEREQAHERELHAARTALAEPYTALWEQWGCQWPARHVLECSLKLPNGDAVNWIMWTQGGRALGNTIDAEADRRGLRSTDYWMLRDLSCSAPGVWDEGPLTVTLALDLDEVAILIRSGPHLTEEERDAAERQQMSTHFRRGEEHAARFRQPGGYLSWPGVGPDRLEDNSLGSAALATPRLERPAAVRAAEALALRPGWSLPS
ncbi:hypothetical protein ACIBBE_24110 [Streptomyces sp. NPDC051644]|uniref:hypothetical protein n=1 Tax=Streptomyces sp. NPDC051644 TaxID=3365666 RepID=UPI003791D185